MDFNSTSADLYGGRRADQSWRSFCFENLNPAGKDVADIGCGGGIYSISFASLGANSVVGVDNSESYITNASSQPGLPENVSFIVGDAISTGLPNNSFDLVYERALIHHLSEKNQILNIQEALRILRKDGIFAVQDRTIEYILNNHSDHWVRATLFTCFPELVEFERARRPVQKQYTALLNKFSDKVLSPKMFSEVRKTYSSLSELKTEIRSRKGKSVLFELTDDQLEYYCQKLENASIGKTLVEIDQWTVWCAIAH
ncbi:MAG: class I SAM-dependent methyltransferase [Gammaproteobacteria bacterium]